MLRTSSAAVPLAPRRDIAEAIAKMRATRKRRSATLTEILEWRNEGRR